MTTVELAELIAKQQRRLIRVYMRAYERLLERLQRQHLAGLSEAHTIALLRDIEGILEQLNVDAAKWIEDTFPKVYRGGSEKALEEIYRRYGEVPFRMNMSFGAVHQQAVERLAFDTYNDLAAATENVSNRLKRSIRLAAERVFPTGVATGETRIQMTKRLVEALQKEGFTQYLDERGRRIKLQDYKDVIGPAGRPLEFKPGQFQSAFLEENWVGFVDKAGRRWDLFNYAEMLTRTKVAEAESRGTEDRLVANGLDLVQITSHNAEDWCSFYEGKVFSISGTHPMYPPLAQAPNGGTPFHPRCRHREAPFIEKFHSPEELEAAKIDPSLLGLNKNDGRADQGRLGRIIQKTAEPGPIYDKNLFQREREIASRNTERCYVLDPAGNVIFTRDGTHDQIAFTTQECKLFKGNTFTHNHPRGTSLSPKDIQLACHSEMAEIRAVGMTFCYSVMPPPGGWNDQVWNATLQPAIQYYNSEVQSEFLGLIRAGLLTLDEASFRHWHEVWTRVAQKTGLQYRRESWVVK